MVEKRSNEIIPGVPNHFTETGIDGDVSNAWSLNHVRALLGKFDELKPVKHYAEYFQEQDEKYTKAGKPGLLKAVMEQSDPKTVAAFDELVDEFNAQLEELIKNRDYTRVKKFVERTEQLKRNVNER